jgi:ABC-2 type transport system permease protein
MRIGALGRIRALVLKDAAELWRNPGVVVPALSIGAASLLPPFIVVVAAPLISGETLAETEEFSAGAEMAVRVIPELAGLTGNALLQGFVLHQFMLLFLLVPVVSAIAVAAHAIIGEKIARTLEPLLATPLSTAELLVAKTVTPFALAMAITVITMSVFVLGVLAFTEPGVAASVVGMRFAVLFLLISPLLAVMAMLLAVIISSRVSDPRSAQQIAVLVILPITAIFVSQLVGQFVIGAGAILLAAVGLLVVNAGLIWVGVRVFDRETILMRWK